MLYIPVFYSHPEKLKKGLLIMGLLGQPLICVTYFRVLTREIFFGMPFTVYFILDSFPMMLGPDEKNQTMPSYGK